MCMWYVLVTFLLLCRDTTTYKRKHLAGGLLQFPRMSPWPSWQRKNMAAGRQAAARAVARSFYPSLQMGGSRAWTRLGFWSFQVHPSDTSSTKAALHHLFENSYTKWGTSIQICEPKGRSSANDHVLYMCLCTCVCSVLHLWGLEFNPGHLSVFFYF